MEGKEQRRSFLVVYFWDDHLGNGWGQMLYTLKGVLDAGAINDISFLVRKDFKERNGRDMTPIIVNIIPLEE